MGHLTLQRLLAALLAAAQLVFALAACTAQPTEITEPTPQVVVEVFKGETGNYSGAEYVSLADMSTTLEDVYGENYAQKTDEYRAQSQSLAAFYDKLYETLLDGQQNGAVSPVNIYMALSLLAECTSGNSRQQILDAVGVTSMEQLREQSKLIWLSNSRDDEKGKSILANSIWLAHDLPVKEDCVNTLKEEHFASAFTGDFKNPDYITALKQWLSDMTNGLLDNSVNALEIPPETAAILASTLYYKVSWLKAYHETEDGTFDGKPCVFNMKTVDRTIYEGKGFVACADSLGDGNRMWFFLPNKNKTVSDVLRSGVVSFINNPSNETVYDVTIRMPDFDVTSQANLQQAFSTLGISECMNQDLADFTALSDDEELYVSDAIHAVRVKADKEGAEGAAYTTMLTLYGGVESKQPYDFTLDRPFVFVIENDGVPLFVGCVKELPV